ncbi:MAG: formate--tetrahydrofolate ligase, partial [Alphaproteobacteria bacterium]|nr:formate--tetrahydrofolate ligase [Alphaproteobacteria bacterium]
STVMAIFCLATDLKDLERRLGNIHIGQTRDHKYVTARDIGAAGAMTVLLKDAFMPNLVQTLENNPVFVHGGPFANIAHGCNSVIATRTALKLGDYVVTEAGFGADLGAEKFFDIKCRKAGLRPAAAVVVATARALKMHGGVAREDLNKENVAAVVKGYENLARHIANVKKFGVPPIVAINRFVSDTDAEIAAIEKMIAELGCRVVLCTHWADGGRGAEELARRVADLCETGQADFKPLYPDEMPLWEKIRAVATSIYGAGDVTADKTVRQRIDDLQKEGYGHFPVCIAKTQYSFSTDPQLKGAPSGHTLHVREVRLSAGSEFLVVIAGDIMTMPGLSKTPAAVAIHIDAQGRVEGLF